MSASAELLVHFHLEISAFTNWSGCLALLWSRIKLHVVTVLLFTLCSLYRRLVGGAFKKFWTWLTWANILASKTVLYLHFTVLLVSCKYVYIFCFIYLLALLMGCLVWLILTEKSFSVQWLNVLIHVLENTQPKKVYRVSGKTLPLFVFHNSEKSDDFKIFLCITSEETWQLQTAEDKFRQTSLSARTPGSPIILVFDPERRHPIPRESLHRGRKYTGWEKCAIFNWNHRLYLKRYEIGPWFLWNVNKKS